MKVTGCANGRSIDANQKLPKDTDTTDMYRSLLTTRMHWANKRASACLFMKVNAIN